MIPRTWKPWHFLLAFAFHASMDFWFFLFFFSFDRADYVFQFLYPLRSLPFLNEWSSRTSTISFTNTYWKLGRHICRPKKLHRIVASRWMTDRWSGILRCPTIDPIGRWTPIAWNAWRWTTWRWDRRKTHSSRWCRKFPSSFFNVHCGRMLDFTMGRIIQTICISWVIITINFSSLCVFFIFDQWRLLPIREWPPQLL